MAAISLAPWPAVLAESAEDAAAPAAGSAVEQAMTLEDLVRSVRDANATAQDFIRRITIFLGPLPSHTR